MTERTKQAVALGAIGVGALMAARAYRGRPAYDFRGRSVVITGGSRGLGLVLARQLAEQGARLTIVARHEDDLHRAADDIRATDARAEVLTVVADVRERHQAEHAIALAFAQYGSVDVLINNAGIIQVGPFDHMKLSDYEDAMNTHFWGPLYTVLAALPHMRHQGEGRIVNISSIGGRIAVPHLLPYCASKFALAGFSDGLRAELAHENILVTTVIPGLMRTGSPVNALFKGRQPAEYAWFAISDSLPLATIDARRAARQIVNGCRHGDAEVTITVQAKLAVIARTLAPELFADGMEMMNRLLPPPAPVGGDVNRKGRELEAPKLTGPTFWAAAKNNEL